MIRPFYSVALLYNLAARPTITFLGTAFAYRHGGFFITAKHCLGALEASQLALFLPLIDHPEPISVARIHAHAEADLAVLELGSIPPADLQPFSGTSFLSDWGEPIQALGFPEESDVGGPTPTARLLSGTIQRKYTHSSSMGYSYVSGETSFGSPAGMSGAPVFSPRETNLVIGVMAENHDSTTFLRSVAEIQDGGNHFSEKVHEVIRYGIFVSLPEVGDWLGKLTN